VYGTIPVNAKVARIFNRVFEVQKPAQNGKILTGIDVFETRGFALTMAALTMMAAYTKRTNC
jgi:hypothetical protein